MIAVDTQDDRLALARELGADETVDGGDGARASASSPAGAGQTW